MSSDEYIAKTRQQLALLNANRPAETLKLALDLKALIQLRIQTSGRNAAGSRFAPYTPAYSLTRQKKGRQTGYVDFTDTGRMWNSIRPQVINSDETTTTIVVRASNAGDQAKLDGQARKRGNILTPSQDEISIAIQANNERVRKYLI